MGKAHRILVVDDMALYRSAIRGCLSSCDDLEVVGTASDGAQALLQVAALKPDALTLDLEMPGMGGLDVLSALRKLPHRPKIIVFSAQGQAGASTSLEALRMGADDFALKPDSKAGFAGIAEELLPKLRALLNQGASVARDAQSMRLDRLARRRIACIASSTGGPQALAAALALFPSNFPVPLLIVQHMPPLFTRSLADSLDRLGGLQVCEASHGLIPEPGKAYIAPGDYHMTLAIEGPQLALHLEQSERIYGLRPAADVLFRSLPTAVGSGAVCAIMTGMGRDGCEGMKQAVPQGIACFTQTASSCAVYGMPQAVDEAGLSHGHFAPEGLLRLFQSCNLRW